MPSAPTPSGYHRHHSLIKEENFSILCRYCKSGVVRISVSKIINLLIKTYVEDFVAPRMAEDKSAEWSEIYEAIPKVSAKVAHRIEPSEFPKE